MHTAVQEEPKAFDSQGQAVPCLLLCKGCSWRWSRDKTQQDSTGLDSPVIGNICALLTGSKKYWRCPALCLPAGQSWYCLDLEEIPPQLPPPTIGSITRPHPFPYKNRAPLCSAVGEASQPCVWGLQRAHSIAPSAPGVCF